MIKFLFLSTLFVSTTLGFNAWNPNRRVDSRCPSWTLNPPVMISDPEDCSRFYKCQGGIAFPVYCPSGQHWNAKDNHCDWPHRANCKAKGESTTRNEGNGGNPTPPIRNSSTVDPRPTPPNRQRGQPVTFPWRHQTRAQMTNQRV